MPVSDYGADGNTRKPAMQVLGSYPPAVPATWEMYSIFFPNRFGEEKIKKDGHGDYGKWNEHNKRNYESRRQWPAKLGEAGQEKALE